jgi:hypothetical protein
VITRTQSTGLALFMLPLEILCCNINKEEAGEEEVDRRGNDVTAISPNTGQNVLFDSAFSQWHHQRR